jgi:hypothetical protein
MTDINFTDIEPGTEGKFSYERTLAEIEAVQHEYPHMWAEVRTYKSPQSAHNAATMLRKTTTGWLFKGVKQSDGSGILWAQYIGGDDADIIESKD